MEDRLVATGILPSSVTSAWHSTQALALHAACKACVPRCWAPGTGVAAAAACANTSAQPGCKLQTVPGYDNCSCWSNQSCAAAHPLSCAAAHPHLNGQPSTAVSSGIRAGRTDARLRRVQCTHTCPVTCSRPLGTQVASSNCQRLRVTHGNCLPLPLQTRVSSFQTSAAVAHICSRS